MTKRFLLILEVDIASGEDYGAAEAHAYIANVLEHHLNSEDRLVDVTAYEVKG